jgi:thiol-disulfide isomerase/thioredoxin
MKLRILPLLLLALPALAQTPQPAVDAVLKDFVRTGEYLLMVNGKPAPVYEIYKNDKLPAYLILSPALPSAVLLTAGSGKVETAPVAKVVRQKEGTVGLAADAALKPQGQFTFAGDKVAFTADGRKATLGPNPPLLGLQKAPALKNHSPEYMVGARNYKPNAQALAALRKNAKPVRVRVFFGSWCPHCKHMLPHILKLEEGLVGSKVTVEYYGLPRPPAAWQDAEVVRLGVKGVPTAIVYVAGREAGRLSSNDFARVELSLSSMLENAK